MDGWLTDSLLYEVDIKTSEVLFSWSAFEHVPISASHYPLTPRGNGTKESPWDFFHINAIESVNDDYLVSGRHVWSVYLVNGQDGCIEWTLEGDTGGDFGALPPKSNFRWQHFARAHNVTSSSMALSMFNNYNSEVSNGTNATVGLALHLTLPPDKSNPPSILRHLELQSEEIYSSSQGSFFPSLSNGNQLMGYGQIPVFREYGSATDGSDVRWEARIGVDNAVQNYRLFKEEWHATPEAWDPVLAIKSNGTLMCGNQTVGAGYVSWNGATDVDAWNVYTSAASNQAFSLKGKVLKRGFETMFNVPSRGCVQIGAVQGAVEIRRSNIACQ